MNKINSNSKRIGILLVAIAAFSWGLSGSCGQFLSQLKGLDPFVIAFIRMAVGGTILMLFELAFRKKKLIAFLKDKTIYPVLIPYALFGVIGCQLTYLEGIAYTNAGVGTMMEQFATIIVLFIICAREKRKPFLREGIAVVFAIFGAILIATHLDPTKLYIPFEGLLWGIGSSITCALYIFLPSLLVDRYSSMEITSVSMIVAAIASLPLLRPWDYAFAIDGGVMFGLSGMIIGGTLIAYLAFMEGIKRAGPVISGLINSTELIWAAIISFVWMGTSLSLYDIAGMICIIVMVALTTITNKE